VEVIALGVSILKDGSRCIIRRASQRDAGEIVRYSNAVGGESDFLSYGLNQFGHNVDEEKQIIREYDQAMNRIFIVAEIDGSICGTLTFWGNSRKRLEHWGEMGISVSKRHWNNGVGTTLLKYFIDWAKDGGIIKKVNLMVREDNHAAVALYKKAGFEVEGRIKRAMKVDGIYYDFLYMGKLIDY
jgi:RimJ/RimL family protein N-acetyltransferase